MSLHRVVVAANSVHEFRGVEQRQLDWLITNRPRVRVPAPQPGIHVIKSVIKTRTNGHMPTSLTCGFVFASRGYPQVYRVNFSMGYQNCVMHAAQGWRTATPATRCGFR